MSLSKFHLSQMLVVAISKLLAKLLARYLTALSRRIGRVNLFIYLFGTDLFFKHIQQLFSRTEVRAIL